jgi:hypothetical protein
MDFTKAEWVNVLLTAIGIGVNGIAIIFVWLQLRQNHRLERASFTNALNGDLNQFVDVRSILKINNTKEKVANISDETYERVLDYFTAFENIRWMMNLRVLTTNEAKEFFGGRFYEAFHSVFFQTKCKDDESFKLMFRLMFELHEKFESTSLAVGYAHPSKAKQLTRKERKKLNAQNNSQNKTRF